MQITAFQKSITQWGDACFGPEVNSDQRIRRNVFLEEAIELFQSMGGTQPELDAIADRAYSRPIGDTEQEIGGVMVTLTLLAQALDLNLEAITLDHQRECWNKIEKIRAKRREKPHAQLETPDALPE